MNEVTIFSSKEFGQVRTVTIDEQVYFVGVDVARALGYSNTQDAIGRHCRGVVKADVTDSSGRRQPMNVITEGDVYRLIMRSKRQEAERFEKWACDEVLPALRKTGTYTVGQKPDSYTIENPAERARRWAEEYEERVALQGEVEKLTVVVKEQKPKADYFDSLIDKTLLTNFRDTAKELGYSQNQFVGWLLENKYVYKDSAGILKPYEQYRKQGLSEMKDFTNPYNGYAGVRTFVTVKGKDVFRLLLQVPDREVV